jgi:hypothetical protein
MAFFASSDNVFLPDTLAAALITGRLTTLPVLDASSTRIR